MITHVVVGYSVGLLSDLDRHLPVGSVLLVEEPHVIEAREVRRTAPRFACLAEVVPAPTQDERDPAGTVTAVPRPAGVRAVLPGVEYGVVAAAALAEAWGLPGAGVEAAKALRDKECLRRVGDTAGIAQPGWARAGGPEDLARLREGFGGRCVLKPANRQASVGVQLLGPADDVAAAWAYTAAAAEPRLWAGGGDRARFLVERLVSGPEVSVEALVRSGVIGFRNITAKSVQDTRYPVETGHVVPAPLSGEVVRALDDAMAALVAATGYRTGMLHAEWIIVDGTPHLIECAGRIPGDSIDLLIDLAYGGSLLGSLLLLLADDGQAPGRIANRAAAIRYLTPPPGELTAINGVDAARACPGVQEVHVAAEIGGAVATVTNSWQRTGYVIATGSTAAAAAGNAERAADLVSLETVAS